MFWFDGLGKSAKDYDAHALNAMIRELQPRILINDRDGLPEDFDTPEQEIGKFQYTRPWESCITLCEQWAWKPNDRMKSPNECLETLVRCAGGDGNLLLNVGPMPDGRIEPRQVKRLEEMGDWLQHYGDAIYGTRGGPWKPGRAFASTRKGNTVFVHLLNYKGKALTLPNLPRKVLSASVLTGGTAKVTQSGSRLVLRVALPFVQPPARGAELLLAPSQGTAKQLDSIVALQLDGSAMDLEPL